MVFIISGLNIAIANVSNRLTKNQTAMKSLLKIMFLLPTTVSLADVAVYKGMQVVKTTSTGATSTKVERFLQVVELDQSQAAIISFSGPGGKTFVAEDPVPVVITEVGKSPRGNANGQGGPKSSTVIAQASQTTDPDNGVVTVSSLLQKGINGQVVLKGTEKSAVPRNLQGTASVATTASVASPANAPAPASLEEIKQTLVLQEAPSKTSNDAGDTLTAAVDRLRAALVASGYTDATPPPPPPPPPPAE